MDIRDTIKLVQSEYNRVVEPLKEIKQIVEEFFGEENVDFNIPSYHLYKNMVKKLMEEDTINPDLFYSTLYEDCPRAMRYLFACFLIHWNTVTVTNEFDESEKIFDLFVKVHMEGKYVQEFSMAKTTFTQRQYKANYVHSHVPRNNGIGFAQPCLGSGPIIKTIHTLKTTYDSQIWGLFCQELDSYVKTESVEGVPYIRLSNIKIYDSVEEYSINAAYLKEAFNETEEYITYIKKIFKEFVNTGSIKFAYKNGSYCYGEPIADIIVKYSNYFIDYIKTNIHTPRIQRQILSNLKKASYMNGSLWVLSTSEIATLAYNSSDFIFFKGNEYHFKVIENDGNDIQYYYIVDTSIVRVLLTKLLLFINCNYGKINIIRESRIF